MNIRLFANFFLLSLLFFAGASHAYEGTTVRSLLNAARSPTALATYPNAPAAPGPVPAASPPAASGNTQKEREESLNKAYADLVETCEGRFGVLNTRFRKQVIRSETISSIGGLIGVLGAVATCPHCAALAAGLAGLANPLQQTFKENSDTPEDTKGELIRLSDVVRTDLSNYRNLPPAIAGDPAFELNLAKRIDALQAADSSCRFYTGKATAAGEEETPKPAAKP